MCTALWGHLHHGPKSVVGTKTLELGNWVSPLQASYILLPLERLLVFKIKNCILYSWHLEPKKEVDSR